MQTHIAMVPRDVLAEIIAANDELMDIVANNVLKRIPKRQSFEATKRAQKARTALVNAIKEDSK